MDTIDKILNLMDENNVTAAQLTREAGITRGLVTQWKQRLQKPSMESISKIAAYFNVSADYLIGKSHNKNIATNLDVASQITSGKSTMINALISESGSRAQKSKSLEIIPGGSEQEQVLLEAFRSLAPVGKTVAVHQVVSLAELFPAAQNEN